MNKPTKHETLAALFMMLFFIAAGTAFYFYIQVRELKGNAQKLTQAEIQNVINKVGKLIVLPEGETPTVATVSDPARLKDQPFFARAKVGDRVLIYTKAKKAILYDEANNKIVEVAPVTIGTPTSSF